MLNECIAAYGNHGGRRMLVKNRDKAYKPSLKFHHEIHNGTEVLYYVDEAVDHLEGMNEHGLGVVYTTSNFQHDNADMVSNNIPIVLQALSEPTAGLAAKALLEEGHGVHGMTYVSGKDATYLIEHNSNTGDVKVKKINAKNAWNVTTNSPSMLAGGIDPANGEDYISCQIRKAVAEASLYGIDNVEEALEALAYKYFDNESHHNMLRDSEYETTCAQIGMDLDGKKCIFTPVPYALDSFKFKDSLPAGHSPKIEFLKKDFTEPALAPFRLFTTKIDESVKKFKLLNYLMGDGPESEIEVLDDKVRGHLEKCSKLKLAQQAADQLWEKEKILVSLVRKLEMDPVFFTAGHTSAQVSNEIEILKKMIQKIGTDYEHLLDIMHQEKYGKPMPMLGESGRTPRKKGQHKGSSSHSDLFTDEDPSGTIHGLGFKDAATAKKGVATVNKAKRDHAHKVQATLVMKQRGKEVIKRTKDPEKKKDLKAANKIWSAHLEKLKKKTKKMNEDALRQYVKELLND